MAGRDKLLIKQWVARLVESLLGKWPKVVVSWAVSVTDAEHFFCWSVTVQGIIGATNGSTTGPGNIINFVQICNKKIVGFVLVFVCLFKVVVVRGGVRGGGRGG